MLLIMGEYRALREVPDVDCKISRNFSACTAANSMSRWRDSASMPCAGPVLPAPEWRTTLDTPPISHSGDRVALVRIVRLLQHGVRLSKRGVSCDVLRLCSRSAWPVWWRPAERTRRRPGPLTSARPTSFCITMRRVSINAWPSAGFATTAPRPLARRHAP